jgi:two-component system chemotaxis response regulator CheB
VAPPRRQLRIEEGPRLALGAVGRCQGDGVFASLARVVGPRAMGVVLTGRLDDASAGVQAIKAHGGRVIAQDRATSAQFAMPASAISTGCVDWVLPLHRIGHALVSLVMWPGAAELLRVAPAPWASLAV